MDVFEFALILSGVDFIDPMYAAVFYENGCDDALFAVQRGVLTADFARDAFSMSEAVKSAIEDVSRAGALVTRVEPDPMASLSDMAERSGLSKAALSLYASGRRGGAGFPPPKMRVTAKEGILWDWHEVAQWLWQNNLIDVRIVKNAIAIGEANVRLQHKRDRIGHPAIHGQPMTGVMPAGQGYAVNLSFRHDIGVRVWSTLQTTERHLLVQKTIVSVPSTPITTTSDLGHLTLPLPSED